MKITVLGCGTSGGVPLIGNKWGSCDPNEPRNRRTRVSVLVECDDITLLLDTSPDLREQLLRCNLQKLTAVLYTHAHADHCHGIDDLRSVNWLMKSSVDIYADAVTMNNLEQKFSYIFESPKVAGQFHTPAIVKHIVKEPFKIGSVEIIPFNQEHGNVVSLGYRIQDFAYSTDVKSLDDKAFDILKGIKVWIVDCVREAPHPTHSHLQQTLEWIERVRPEQAYLTHMNNTMDYATLLTKLPKGVWPAYDGLVIEC